MRNSIPTHYAITQAQAGKIQTYSSYAKSILVLIGHDYQDGIDGESDEFLTSSQHIRAALSAVRHFVEEIEENSKGGIYLTPEQPAFVQDSAAKILQIEHQRLAQTVKGGSDE